MTEPISSAKIRALEEALERDGAVNFKNGSSVEAYEDEGQEWIVVTRKAGGVVRYKAEEVRRAYAMALNGPASKQQSSDGSEFGDGVPW